MDNNIAYGLMLATLGFFGYIGYNSVANKEINSDEYLSARGTQNSMSITLSLFASGMGIWVLLAPSEVGYYGGFWDVFGYALSASTPFLLLAYVGPMVRERLPEGVTLADYAKSRAGRPMQIYVGLISILYMFTFLFAEFTAIGKVMEILVGIDPLVPMVSVGFVTAAYTAYGGLPASLETDKIQAWGIIFLITTLLVILFSGDINILISDAKSYTPEDIEWDWYHGSISDTSTFKSGFALVVAITAAEMFSQGNWQRAWASEDEKSLKKGAIMASLIVFPLIFVMGFLGTSVAGQGALSEDEAAVSFFYLIEDIGLFFVVAFVILSIALVCSSADTLQNAIIASISRDIYDDKISLNSAKYLTVAMVPLAIYLATGPTIAGFELDSGGVFEIFLRADLYAAATVGPVLLTLWDRVSSTGSLFGAFSGILSVVIYGTLTEDFSAGIDYLFSPTNDAGLANLEVFLSALLGSSIVTILLSYIIPDDE
jgi:Na+/proline symporter